MINKNSFDGQCITYSQMNLISNVRIFFRRLATWTRAYIIGRYRGIGTEQDLFGRLYLESSNFGNMLQLFFGRESAEKNMQLLNEYAIILRELISAQLEGDSDRVREYVDRLYLNADRRAAQMASVNPYFDETVWRNLLYAFTRYNLEVANSFAAGDYSRDIKTFDILTALTDRMGDYLAQTIYDYITSGAITAEPSQSGELECITYDRMNEIYDIRMFWFDLAAWTRAYMLARYAGVGNVDEVYARLRRVPEDYVNNLRKFFGETAGGNELQIQLSTYLDLIDALITAQMDGNVDEINRITRLLYQNADERAASVTSINPFWNVDEWRARLYDNLRYTIDQSETFLTGEYGRNLDIFSTILDLADSTSAYFAQGLFQYQINRQQA